MPSIWMLKGIGSLRPADQIGEEAMAKIKPGQYVRVQIRRPRSVQHHRLFYALVTRVYENLPERYGNIYPAVENLIDAIKIANGYFDPIVSLEGEVIGQKPKSLAFHKMGQDEFREFFDRTADLLVNHFLPEVGKEALMREVDEMLHRSTPAQAAE